MTVDARHLRAFLAIASRGSITHAAASLHLTQPAVSRLLRQLEDHPGRQLVDRSTHHLHLTVEGERYALRAAGAVRALDTVLDSGSMGRYLLRVGYAWSAFGRHTSAVVAGWREQHPGTPVELRRMDDRLGGLLRGGVDAAIVRDLDPAIEVNRRWICVEPRMAALPQTHPLTVRNDLTLGELTGETLVLNTTSGTTSTALWRAGSVPTATHEVSNTDDWLVAIASGAGVGLTSIATAEMYPIGAVTYRPVIDAPPITVELAWLPPATHPLIEEFAAHCRRVAAT